MTLLFLVILNSGNKCVVYDDTYNTSLNTVSPVEAKIEKYRPWIKSISVYDANQIQAEFIQEIFPDQIELPEFVAYCNK